MDIDAELMVVTGAIAAVGAPPVAVDFGRTWVGTNSAHLSIDPRRDGDGLDDDAELMVVTGAIEAVGAAAGAVAGVLGNIQARSACWARYRHVVHPKACP